jgi:hypothetical protein
MSRQCQITNCTGRRLRGGLHCASCERVLDHMDREVSKESGDSSWMKFGRTWNPARRNVQHARSKAGLTRLRVLLVSEDPYRLCSLESAGIRRLSRFAKLKNRTTKSLGGLRTDVPNCLYIASRPKKR